MDGSSWYRNGGPPIAKSVEFSSVPGREGLHLLGQSLRKKNPFFAALFRILTPRGGVKFCMEAVGAGSAFARYQGHGLELPLVRGVGSQGW